jgi:hypothetical protein
LTGILWSEFTILQILDLLSCIFSVYLFGIYLVWWKVVRPEDMQKERRNNNSLFYTIRIERFVKLWWGYWSRQRFWYVCSEQCGLNIKWNMTENNDMCNTLAYPKLILVRYWYTHLKAFRKLTLSVFFGLQNTVAFIYHIP